VITAEVVASVLEDLDDEQHPDERVRAACQWCTGRAVVLLVDDSSPDDDLSADVCHEVVFGQAAHGWEGESV